MTQDQNEFSPPGLIFFEPDDIAEEAEFIRVDDLFREAGELLPGRLLFTLFPGRKGRYLSARLSRAFRRALLLTGMRLEKTPEKVRIRPLFIQWQLDLSAEDDAGAVAGAFRADLEAQADLLQDLPEGERFWSDSCFVCPENDLLTDEMINRLVTSYQEPAAGGSYD